MSFELKFLTVVFFFLTTSFYANTQTKIDKKLILELLQYEKENTKVYLDELKEEFLYVRSSLEALLNELDPNKGLHSIILGENNAIINAGCSKYSPIQLINLPKELAKLPDAITLTELSKRLNSIDLDVSIYTHHLTKVKDLETASDYQFDNFQREINLRFKRLSEYERSLIVNNRLLNQWITETIGCLTNRSAEKRLKTISYPIKAPDGSIHFDFVIDYDKLSTAECKLLTRTSMSFQKYILSSYPWDGMYNLHIKESYTKMGYIKYDCTEWKNYFLKNPLLVRWQNVNNKVQYTRTYNDLKNQIIYFFIPVKFLDHNELYKVSFYTHKNYDYNPFAKNCFTIEEFIKSYLPNHRPIKTETDKIYEMYIRTSLFDTFTEKSEINELSIDSTTFSGTLTLFEPIGAFEFQQMLESRKGGITVKSSSDDFGVKRVNLNRIKNYFAVPRTENCQDSLFINKKLFVDLNHTSHKEGIRNLNRFGGEVNEHDILFNGYNLPLVDPNRIQVKLAIDDAPKITKENFTEGRFQLRPSIINFHNLEPLNSYEFNVFIKEQLKKRVEQRAKFFYCLDQRDNPPVQGATFSNLEEYLNYEKSMLPNFISSILDEDIEHPKIKENTRIFIIRRYLPGTDATAKNYFEFKLKN